MIFQLPSDLQFKNISEYMGQSLNQIHLLRARMLYYAESLQNFLVTGKPMSPRFSSPVLMTKSLFLAGRVGKEMAWLTPGSHPAIFPVKFLSLLTD